MQTVFTLSDLKAAIVTQKKKGSQIGFVPTMGALHTGHMSLLAQAVKASDFTVVSVFVNPTQFGPQEDFKKYPRCLAADQKRLAAGQADLLFYPRVQDVYPDATATATQVYVPQLSRILCGKTRPQHFRGVCSVVCRLFNMVQPDQAFFGEKDFQQLTILKKMTKDLALPVKIRACPIIREKDGLAMSSRNVYLNPEERRSALSLSRALVLAGELYSKGERDAALILEKVREKQLEVGDVKQVMQKIILVQQYYLLSLWVIIM